MKVRLPNGIAVRATSRGESLLMYDEIFTRKIYLKNGIELREGDLIFDVGANLGMFSLFLGQTLRDFSLYAFEPIPDVFKTLQHNTAALADKVKLFNVGLSDQEADVHFAFYPHLPCFSTSCPEKLDDRWIDLREILMRMGGNGSAGGQGFLRRPRTVLRSWCTKAIVAFVSVKKDRLCHLSRLSNILRENQVSRIDLLKIDVEGNEWNVLRGIDDADWSKIKQVVMEVHYVGDGPHEIVKELTDRGFAVTIDHETEDRKAPLCMLYANRDGDPAAQVGSNDH